VLAVAHRAGNDLALLAAAAAIGADLYEADLALDSGQVDVRHLRTLGPVPLLWDRWRLVRASAPRLALPELLAAAGDLPLLLDLKGAHPALAVAVRAALPNDRPYWVCSRGWRQLEVFRGLEHVRVVHSVGSARELRALPGELARYYGPAQPGTAWPGTAAGGCTPAGGVSVHARLLSPSVVARLHTLTPLVLSWPVNTPRRLAQLPGWGVDGAITDSPDVLRRLRQVAAG